VKPVILWSDALLFLLLTALALQLLRARGTALQGRWHRVFQSRLGMGCATLLLIYLLVATLDSLHFRRALEPLQTDTGTRYSNEVHSVLDVLTLGMGERFERSYSAPFALHALGRQSRTDASGRLIRDFPRLRHGGSHLAGPEARAADIARRTATGALIGGLLAALLILPQWYVLRRSPLPWHVSWAVQGAALVLGSCAVYLSQYYHVLGTGLGGEDVLYQSLKGIRTALLLSVLATLAMLPPALLFGLAAGYFRGWVDDVVQYLYTTLSSVPGILLVAAAVLLFQVHLELNPQAYETGLEQADVRFLGLCLILGLSSWATLCRLLRAETMKLSQLDYVRAARAFGAGHLHILRRHILPNLAHLILITAVLELSALVLAEAVLSYIGVGVDPSMGSWGNMIHGARSELARAPLVWWNLAGAFALMFGLVLSVNLLADRVREAFDPRLQPARGSA
jgi:peptide/nickel transport system permease protein